MTNFCAESPSYGQVNQSLGETAELIPSTRPSCAFELQRATWCWTPPADLCEHFHADFSISFHCYVDNNGLRRFLPASSTDRFIDDAFAAGLALLTRDRQLTWQQRSCYQAMKLIFERVRGMQEHLLREFNYSRDLHIRQRGRATDSDRSVLPQHLCGVLHAWSPRQLCEEGRARAAAEGVEQISTSLEISYGLLAAAERNPLQIEDPDEVKGLMRMALFSPARDDELLTAECLEDVYGRLIDLLNAHRTDAEADFQNWYRGPNNNLFKAIGGRKWKAAVVRKAMLQLGWQAYEYVSGCINYFVQAFMQALPDCLNTDERELFSCMYQPQAELGGLPVILLLERHQLIRPVIGRYWSNPTDDSVIPVLHQLLAFYAEMTDERRAADRRSKGRQGHLEAANSPLAETHSTVPSQRTDNSPVGRMLRALAERREWRCDLCDLPPLCALNQDAQRCIENDQSVVVEYCCAEHGNHRQVEISLAELRGMADELGIEAPD